MGVDIFKGFTFGGKYSKNYGVYITGEAVFNAPSRDVEMISIPGRNGNLALDNGRYNNIEVTYPAGLFAKTESEFAEAISDFRNFLCSKKGYVRLEDEYNPNEYRMAVYKSGLEVSHKRLKAGEFDIVFECKPQRYLKSGETAVSVSDGGTLTNPTLFEAHPLLMVEGYGDINVNGYGISVANATLGEVVVADAIGASGGAIVQSLDANLFNTGDELTAKGANTTCSFRVKSSVTSLTINYSIFCQVTYSSSTRRLAMHIDEVYSTFTAGTDESANFEPEFEMTYTIGGVQTTATVTVDIDRVYDAQAATITHTLAPDSYPSAAMSWVSGAPKAGEVIADSSISILGTPTYLDCEIGEAYKYEGDSYVPLNRHIDLGSKLPELSPGNNEIEYDNTITDLKVVPNWWKV